MSHSLAPHWRHIPENPNALHAGVWPASSHRDAAGELIFGGVSARDLVETYGTPLYVVDQAEVEARVAQFRDIVATLCEAHGVKGLVYYASKALTTGHVVRWVSDLGVGFDVASGGEMAIALAGGAAAAHLEFQGNNKSVAEIRDALRAGVGCIVIDAPIEAGRIDAAAGELGMIASVMVRVNTGVHADTHEYLATAREDQKFGLSPEETLTLVADIRQRKNLQFEGLHSHIGSQIFEVDGFLEAATRIMDLYQKLLPYGAVPTLNLGGGFGIAYTEADQPMDIHAMMTAIVDHVATEASRRGVPMPDLAFEPGRMITGPAGVTLYRVGVVKPVVVHGDDGSEATRVYVSVDGGMSDNARPALYRADYSTRIASRISEAPPALVRVVGKHCESGDIVVDADYLPSDVAPGDVLAIAATGAYCYSLSSNYNALGRPPMVGVNDGEHFVMVQGESITDVLSRDQGFAKKVEAKA